MLYFEMVSTCSLFVGLLLVNWLQPGAGMNIDASKLDASSVAMYATGAQSHTAGQFFMNIIPSTVVDGFAKGEILQILLFSILFGWALSKLGSSGAEAAAHHWRRIPCLVRDCRYHHETGTDRNLWRYGLYDWRLWHRILGAIA